MNRHEGQRLCLCLGACVCVSVRKAWCPWLSSVYRQEMFVQGKREGTSPPHMANTGSSHTHAHTHTGADVENSTQRRTLETVKKEESDASGARYLVLGEVGVSGPGTHCSSLPSTPAANENSGR